MMLPEYKGRRFYVNDLTGWPIYAGRLTSYRLPTTTFSVHDAHFGGECVASYDPPHGSQFLDGRRTAATQYADRLNAEWALEEAEAARETVA
jgi:hypothetical protein